MHGLGNSTSGSELWWGSRDRKSPGRGARSIEQGRDLLIGRKDAFGPQLCYLDPTLLGKSRGAIGVASGRGLGEGRPHSVRAPPQACPEISISTCKSNIRREGGGDGWVATVTPLQIW